MPSVDSYQKFRGQKENDDIPCFPAHLVSFHHSFCSVWHVRYEFGWETDINEAVFSIDNNSESMGSDSNKTFMAVISNSASDSLMQAVPLH